MVDLQLPLMQFLVPSKNSIQAAGGRESQEVTFHMIEIHLGLKDGIKSSTEGKT